MAIIQEITRIQGAKSDIKSAIEAKGVTVPSNALIDTYDDYVAAIPSGGGGNKMGEFVDVDPSATYSGNYKLIDFIEEVVVPEGITQVTEATWQGYLGFRNFTNLKSVSLPSTLSTLGGFSGCRSLTSVTFASPSNLRAIPQYCFQLCTSLTSIVIPEGVTSVDGFSGCTSLASVTFPSTLTTIAASAFSNTALTSITIPSTVTSINENSFYSCGSLTTVSLPSSLTSIGIYSFGNCHALPSITIPSGVTSIGDNCFAGSRSLTSITCEAVNPPTLGTDALSYTALAHIYVPAASVNDYKAASGWSTYASIIEAIPSN